MHFRHRPVAAAHNQTDCDCSAPPTRLLGLCRVGLQPPTVTVRYQHLRVLSRMTVGDRSLPTLKKTVKRRAEVSCHTFSPLGTW